MLHPDAHISFINSTMGYGIFASKFIPKGTIIYIKDALEIEIKPEDYLKYLPQVQEQIEKYAYMNELGVRIISWDFAKYVNHCCQPNTLCSAYEFDIAVRDIAEGEEITCDYGMLNVEAEMALLCSKPDCRGTLRPTDFESNITKWDKHIKAALVDIPKVTQPLLPYMNGNSVTYLKSFLNNENTYVSVSKMRYKPLISNIYVK